MIYAMIDNWSWGMLLLGLVISKIFNIIGNEAGLHRLWCHKSYTTSRWKEYILHAFAIPLLYGSSISYAGIHRQHHAYADTDKDPHVTQPWWLIMFFIKQEKYVIERKFVKDLIRDPLHSWIHLNYFKINVLILVLFLLIAGPYYTGWLLSYMVIHNFIGAFLVNTLGHYPKFGTRTFDTRDNSSNNTFLKWLTWNEGYHNHHHANPGSYTYVVNKGEFDCPAIIIKKFLMDTPK
jgi:stearoyl-CoA desaturase (delta-9 desaturase)